MYTSLTTLAADNKKSPFEGMASKVHKTMNLLKFCYDFGVGGGVVGDVACYDDEGNLAKLPIKALVLNCFFEVETAVVGASSTVAFKSEAAADLLGATAEASLGASVKVQGIPDFATLADSKKMTAERQIYATIAVANLTAGKVWGYCSYVIGK